MTRNSLCFFYKLLLKIFFLNFKKHILFTFFFLIMFSDSSNLVKYIVLYNLILNLVIFIKYKC